MRLLSVTPQSLAPRFRRSIAAMAQVVSNLEDVYSRQIRSRFGSLESLHDGMTG